MKEEFLHYVWKYRLFDQVAFTDIDGNSIEVVAPGEYNRDSGPDFFNARIRTAGALWAGNVEIHLNSSDWSRHGHQNDPAYNNVILHVVGRDDMRSETASGTILPVAVLKPLPEVYDKYLEFTNNPLLIACQKDLARVDSYLKSHWITCLAMERLQEKAEAIGEIFRETGSDWEETFYRLLARYFGARVNTDNFERLARALPLKLVRKHADNPLQVEALLYGTAGMLSGELFREAIGESYLSDLMREYRVLSKKYSLVPMHGWLWKFHRLRPAGFPTIRISQLAALLSRSKPLFSEITEAAEISDLRRILDNPSSEYWSDHYSFGKQSGKRTGHAGEETIDILIINVVVPMLFLYGKKRGNDDYCTRAVDLLEMLKPEANRVTREWKQIGVSARSALESQALNTLLNSYCRRRRCIECRIGQRLIALGREPDDHTNTLLER
jgi:hypothetical protein